MAQYIQIGDDYVREDQIVYVHVSKDKKTGQFDSATIRFQGGEKLRIRGTPATDLIAHLEKNKVQ
jgi:hypothetical protein